MNNKPPRQYAAEICQLPTREERKAALELVPELLQGIVEEHVRNHFALKKFRSTYV